MNNYTNDSPDFLPIIRSSVSAYQAGQAMGLNPGRDGRCPCPIHGGKDRNMRLYHGDGGYYCFVCGSHGDVIQLTENVMKLSFKDAMEWLNSTFSLGLNIDAPMDKNAVEAAKKAKERRDRERERKQDEYREKCERALDADMLLTWAEKINERYHPRIPGDEFDWRWAAAMRLMPELKRDAEITRIEAAERG